MAKVLDPRKKQLTLAELVHRRDQARKNRRPFERDWVLNLAYVHGEQYVNFEINGGRLVERNTEDEDRSVHNVFAKMSRVERAKMLRDRPKPTVLPSSTDSDAEAVARVLEGYFNQLKDEWSWERKMRRLSYWVVNTGNGYLKWTWNGGNKLDVVSPFELYIDPYAREFANARWVVHGRFYDEETAWDMYGDTPKAKMEHMRVSSSEAVNNVEHRVYSDIGIVGDERNLEGVNVYEYWEPPTKGLPQGRFIVFTDSGIVLNQEFPYEHGRMPFTHTYHIERGSSKYASSALDTLRDLQDEVNRAENQNIQNRNAANPKWFIPAGLELDAEIDATARQILRAIGGGAGLEPRPIAAESYPQWASSYPDRIKDALQDLMGQHEVSNAGVPGEVSSGSAIMQLREADDAVGMDMHGSMAEAMTSGFWMAAALAKQYAPNDILVKSYDRDGHVEVSKLKTDDIDLNFVIRVQTSSALPTGIAARWDRVVQLVQLGILPPMVALEMLDLPQEEPSTLPTLEDRKKAYRENHQMSQMDSVSPLLHQDHDTHIAMHSKFMNTREFENAPEDVQELFIEHVGTHLQLRMERMQLENPEPPPPDEGAPPQPDETGPPPIAAT